VGPRPFNRPSCANNVWSLAFPRHKEYWNGICAPFPNASTSGKRHKNVRKNGGSANNWQMKAWKYSSGHAKKVAGRSLPCASDRQPDSGNYASGMAHRHFGKKFAAFGASWKDVRHPSLRRFHHCVISTAGKNSADPARSKRPGRPQGHPNAFSRTIASAEAMTTVACMSRGTEPIIGRKDAMTAPHSSSAASVAGVKPRCMKNHPPPRAPTQPPNYEIQGPEGRGAVSPVNLCATWY